MFIKLDLTKVYYQMKLYKDSKKATAFSSPKGLFQWKILLMDMKTSGDFFQKIMDDMLGDLQP